MKVIILGTVVFGIKDPEVPFTVSRHHMGSWFSLVEFFGAINLELIRGQGILKKKGMKTRVVVVLLRIH